MTTLLILVNITCSWSLSTIVPKIIQTQYNRFFSDTRVTSIFMSIFPPNALCSPVWLWCSQSKVFQLQSLSLQPRKDSVLPKYKCSFSLLISEQGFQKRFEIALFSTVLQRCSLSPPTGTVLAHNLSVFGCHSLIHTSNCRCRVFSWQGPPFIYIPSSSYSPLTPYRCSYRFTRQSLVVLRRRSHRTSRLLTSE